MHIVNKTTGKPWFPIQPAPFTIPVDLQEVVVATIRAHQVNGAEPQLEASHQLDTSLRKDCWKAVRLKGFRRILYAPVDAGSWPDLEPRPEAISTGIAAIRRSLAAITDIVDGASK